MALSSICPSHQPDFTVDHLDSLEGTVGAEATRWPPDSEGREGRDGPHPPRGLKTKVLMIQAVLAVLRAG